VIRAVLATGGKPPLEAPGLEIHDKLALLDETVAAALKRHDSPLSFSTWNSQDWWRAGPLASGSAGARPWRAGKDLRYRIGIELAPVGRDAPHGKSARIDRRLETFEEGLYVRFRGVVIEDLVGEPPEAPVVDDPGALAPDQRRAPSAPGKRMQNGPS
jgi:hypothetical protein